MRLLTLLAWYAAGLAVAMKVRRDAGQSKLDQRDPSKSTLDKLVDEVKDIHTSTYADVKAYVAEHFSDVHDFDSLKARVTTIVDTIADEAEAFVTSLEKKWTAKKADIEARVDTFFDEKSSVLEEAKAKWALLTDTTTDAVVTWVDEAKSRLLSLRDTIKKNIKLEVTVEKTPVKKPAAKKAPAKKPAAKKPPAKKPQA
jgi:hypothetical protein